MHPEAARKATDSLDFFGQPHTTSATLAIGIPPYPPLTASSARMYQHMPPTNPRKRPAPGAAPVQPQMSQQAYPAPNQATQSDYLRWNQPPDNAAYPEPAGYNVNNYNANGLAQAQFDQSLPAQSTQLARRPMNRGQLVQTGQRSYDDASDPWGQFGDDALLDPQHANGALMENHDDIEVLEEKAAAAKRDATSKRKQIPPFVQKLSR